MNNISKINNNKINYMEKTKDIFKEGDIFTGELINKENGNYHFLLSDGKSFVGSGVGMDFNIGDNIRFKAIKKDDNIALKFLEKVNEPKKISGVNTDTKEILSKHSLLNEENIFEIKSPTEYGTNSKEELAISRIKSKLNHGTKNISSLIINELLASGISLGALNLGMINNVIKTVRENPMDIDMEKLEEISNKDYEKAYGLIKNNLPINDENLEFMDKVESKINEIKELDNSSISSIMKNSENINMENIYKGKYSAYESKEISEENYNKLKEDIIRIFKREDIENTEGNMNIAKIFIGNEIVIDKNNFNIFNFLNNLKNISENEIMDISINGIKEGLELNQISISEEILNISGLNENYKEILKAMDKINNNTLFTAESLNIPLTLYNLRNLAGSTDIIEGVPKENHRIELMEIKLKLNYEIAYELSKKGIDIDTKSLKEALDDIKNMEKIKYENILKESNMDTNENINTMTNVFDTLSRFNNLSPNVFKKIMDRDTNFTLEGISDSNMERYYRDLENLQTIPRAKFGDGFNKIKDEYENLLENLDIKVNEANIRGAVILSRADIEINDENLLQIKIIDRKIEDIHNKLHPEIAMDMINDGLNPLDLHIDEILEYIDLYNNKYGDSLKDNIGNYIYDMKKENISEDKEKALINIYKALYNIENYGSAAIGVNYKKGGMDTLRNLLDASTYFNKTKGRFTFTDIKINDSFGELKYINNKDSIRSILDRTYQKETNKNVDRILNFDMDNLEINEINKAVYNDIILKNMGEILSPEVFNQLDDDYLDKPLEETLEQIENIVNNKEIDINKISKDIENVLKTKPEIIKEMEDLSIPLSFSNIRKYKEIPKNREALQKISENEDINILENDFYTKDFNINEYLNELEDSINNLAVESKDFLDEIRIIQNSLRLSRKMRSPNMPVKINGEVKDLNIYVSNKDFKNLDEFNLIISIKGNRGEFYMSSTIKDNEMWIKLNEPQNFADTINKEKLVEYINEAGFKVNNINGFKINNDMDKKDISNDDIFLLGSKICKYINFVERVL